MKKLSIISSANERIWGWIYYAIQLVVLPLLLAYVNIALALDLTDAELNFIFFCINFLCLMFIFRRFLIENGRIALQAPAKILNTAIFGFVGYWVTTIVVSNFIMRVSVSFFNVNDFAIADMVSDNFALMIIGTVVLVPAAEEVVYRGLIFGSIYNKSRILAYLISTLAFALLHVFGYIGQYEPLHLLLCLLEYVPAGVCLGWAYAKSDSIWTPILIHTSINLIGILAMR